MNKCCCNTISSPGAPLWVDGSVETAALAVPRVRAKLALSDTLGSWKARWGIGRMRYTVAPGLYAVGSPTAESPVFVTANYKMTFDRLRSALSGRDGWILVLDTRGINVWCAAGGGLFSTEEIVNRLAAVRLAEIVSHRPVILPQLAAPGVSAREVERRTGFRVVFGPVRAADLPAFLDAGMKATGEMRRVRFDFADRVVLAPMEIVLALKYAVVVCAALILSSGLSREGYSLARALSSGAVNAGILLGTVVAAAVGTAAFLPWLPGRAFSMKGAWLGGALALVAATLDWAVEGLFANDLAAAAWLVMIPSISSFIALNFTGATPITSLSGVRAEMRRAIPLEVLGGAAGLALWIAALFL